MKKLTQRKGIVSKNFAFVSQSKNNDTKVTHSSSEVKKSGIGGLLAESIAKTVLLDKGKKEQKRFKAEAAVIESFKRETGWNFAREVFDQNTPILFHLEPLRRNFGRHNPMIKDFGKTDGTNARTASRESKERMNYSTFRPHGSTSSSGEIKFEKTQLFAMLSKDPTQRTESDMKELRSILMKLDFIKNSDHNLAPTDLTELVKSAEMHGYEAGERILKQDTDSNSMCFILQGRILATYHLAQKDKAAIFLGKKDAANDGLVKTFKTL